MSEPIIQYIEVWNDGRVFAQFDQPIYFDGITLDGFTIIVSGTPVLIDNSAISGANGSSGLVFATTPAIYRDDTVEVAYAGSDLHNLDGDPVQAFTESDVSNFAIATPAPPPTGPDLTLIEVWSDGRVFAQFDQPVYFDGITLDGFTITVNGSPVPIDNNQISGANGSYTLVFSTTPAINQGDSVQVSYAGSDLHNLSGDPVQAFAESSLMNGSWLLCFLKNTHIQTVGDEVEVQALKIGDLVITIDGLTAPVKWIGKQRFNPRFSKENLPICISSGALGNGLPLRDLYVSPDHAMYLDDCILVHAKALVNGSTIYQVTEWEGDVEYFHIETDNHEIIFAEGSPTETFIDNVSREAFYNHAEYEALYPNAKPMIELDIPRVKYARQLPMAVECKLKAIADYDGIKVEKVAGFFSI